jgi:hypothetical protein
MNGGFMYKDLRCHAKPLFKSNFRAALLWLKISPYIIKIPIARPT